MSRRNNTKVDYKALHEGRMANSKAPSSEDSMINVSQKAHDSDLDASIAQLTMKRDELAKEEARIALLLEIEKQKVEIETMRCQMAALQTTNKASTSQLRIKEPLNMLYFQNFHATSKHRCLVMDVCYALRQMAYLTLCEGARRSKFS